MRTFTSFTTMHPIICRLALIGAAALATAFRASAIEWDAPPALQTKGQFWRLHWYERGLTNANFAYERRLRVNSPEVVLHPQFGKRIEARENGLLLIKAEDDLFQLTGAELYVEMWGGHPGTANKRVTVNGRSTYLLPRVGTEDGHCTYFYPSIPLKLNDLVNGYDAFQFALDQGTTFWGHALIDNACLRVALTNGHTDIVEAGLVRFSAWVKAEPSGGANVFKVTLECVGDLVGRIAAAEFQGWYDGYDENGNTLRLDWHGFTKNRQPVAMLGTARQAPFFVTWDTLMLPAQKEVAVRALVRFKDAPALIYATAAATGLQIAERQASEVVLIAPHDLPKAFWLRARQRKQCSLDLDIDPARIENAELHVLTWTGGPGTIKEYFKLNDRHYAVAEGANHELIYSRLEVDPKSLRRALNPIELLSDTEHHGIEVIYPGPVLAVRYRTGQN